MKSIPAHAALKGVLKTMTATAPSSQLSQIPQDREIDAPTKTSGSRNYLMLAPNPTNPPPEFLEQTGIDANGWYFLTAHCYPAAKTVNSIMSVVRYCSAHKLDPLSKAVSIVPLWNAKTRQMEDSIWPGIALYEIRAHRTGVFAGTEKAEYGPIKTFEFQPTKQVNGKPQPVFKIDAPEWATATVYRLVQGQKCAFTAEAYFSEFVALVKGSESEKAGTPNEMWRTKGRMMLAKCALAAALRLAFPEIGNIASAEEMEGGQFDLDYEPSAKDAKELAKAKAIEKAKIAQAELFGAEENGDDTVDAEVFHEGETSSSKPVEPATQQVLEAAKELNEDAGNDQVVEAINQTIAKQEKITQKEVGALNKACLAKGLKIKDAVDIMESKFGIVRDAWVSTITMTQYQEVLAEIEAR